MGPVSQGSASLDEISSLLSQINDPAKLKSAVDSLKAEKEAMMSAFHQNQAALADLKKLEDKIAAESQALALAQAESKQEKLRLSAFAEDLEKKAKDLHQRKAELDQEKLGFDIFKAKYLVEVDKRQKDIEQRMALAQKKLSDAEELSQKLEAKMAKLKQLAE